MAVCLQPSTLWAQSTDAADSLQVARTMAERREDCVAAFALAARQLDLAQSLPARTAPVFRTLAVVAHHGGDTGTALIFSEAARAVADAVYEIDSPRRAPYLLSQALAVRLSGRAGAATEARRLVTEGLDLLADAGPEDQRVLADLQQAQANLTRAGGDLPRAIDLYTQALDTRLTRARRHDLAVVDNESWRALATLFTGELPAAGRQLRHCLDDLQDLGLATHPLSATITAHLAIIAEAQGDLSRATELTRQAATDLRQAQSQIFPGFSRRRLTSPLLNALADLCQRNGDSGAAWQALVAGHQIFGAQAAALAQARQLDPVFARRVRVAATASSHMVGEVEAALAGLRQDGDDTGALTVLTRYARQMARVLTLKDELRRRFGDRQPEMPTVEQVQTKLARNQTVVAYFKSYRHDGPVVPDWTSVTHVVVLGKTGPPVWIELPAPTPERALPTYARLMAKASEWPLRLADDPAVTTLRHELYTSFFAPIEPYLTGTDEVLLIAGELQPGFPFPALLDATDQALVDRFAFRHLLGIEILADEVRDVRRAERPSLVLGDPLYDSKAVAVAAADPTLAEAVSTYANTVLSRSMVNGVLAKGAAGLAQLPRLRSSGWEARSIAGMTTPVTLLTGGAATEQNLNAICRNPDAIPLRWVHLATHALMHNAMPERSALALAPRDGEGLLYVEEIGFGWTLDCDLVTLSGCQTGSGPNSWESGPLGFVQALHAAGARNLLLSTSKVDDIATALLMERFYADVSGHGSSRVQPAASAPLSYSRALAEAQRWLRDLQGDDRRRPFAHPVYWANFRLLGSGG